MILSGNEIRRQVQEGRIEITPFRPDHINPASVDLTLGDEIGVYANWVEVPFLQSPNFVEDGRGFRARDRVFDIKEEPYLLKYKISPEKGWVLRPGIGYLAHTAERVNTDFFVPILDGKSSIGRLFVKIHETAGFGDPHFNGQYTLEVTAMHPIRIYAGMRFCQIRFHKIEGDVTPYEGNYAGDDARGPVASKAWRQFKGSSPP
jgi:dCTP deaminase